MLGRQDICYTIVGSAPALARSPSRLPPWCRNPLIRNISLLSRTLAWAGAKNVEWTTTTP